MPCWLSELSFPHASYLVKDVRMADIRLTSLVYASTYCVPIATLRQKQAISITVEPRFNEPLFNEVLDITNDFLCPSQSCSKMHGIEPRYNEFFDIANIIRKPKRKIYLDITNYNVNTRQKINAEQINSQQIL